MTRPLVFQPPIDRLKVFVSSTIRECNSERMVAREAIRSLNHEPILFEDIGARPHPPRDLYRARLENSEIFVGIYREEYGWVAPEMDVSGIEDEYSLASERAMDRLVYVFGNPTSRDPKLQDLINRAMSSDITIAFYSEPDELRDRIRHDLTAVVSSRFVEQDIMVDEDIGANKLLDSLLPDPNHRFRRPDVEAALLSSLESTGRLIVHGPLGAGKTILLAQLAAEHGWIFVDGRGHNHLDVLAQVANALRACLGQHRLAFRSEQTARSALLAAWRSSSAETLAIDAAADPEPFWELPESESRIVLTSRRLLEVPAPQQFEIPPLSRSETRVWISALRRRQPEPGELGPLYERSGGNPLFLRFYALGEPDRFDLSLRDLEIRAYQALSPRAKEVVSYLTVAGSRLAIEDLQHLLGAEGVSPEAVLQLASEARSLLRQDRNGVEILHEHPRQSLLDQLRTTPTRLGFFAKRLGDYFASSGDYVQAFHAFSEAGAETELDRILNWAAYQAARRGGGAPAIEIFRRMAETSAEFGNIETEVRGLLGLAQTLQQTGARADAAQALEQAREAAQQSGADDLLLDVQETSLLADIPQIDSSERLEGLRELQQARAERGEEFEVARTATLVSAEHIAAGDYASAEEACLVALAYFEREGDQHGIRVARINLFAALSGMDGREREAAAMAHVIHETIDPAEHPRERAVICNLLTRRHRQRGNTAAASAFATEAIQIGQVLDDQHLIAINRINLGNVHRDEGHLELALDEYRAADRAAAKGNLRRDEAAANELIASVLNEQGTPTLARAHAQHAISLARLAGDPILESRAGEELAIALTSLREIDAAVAAYVSAARVVSPARSDREHLFCPLVCDALALAMNSTRPDLITRTLADVFAPGVESTGAATIGDRLALLLKALPNLVRSASAECVQPLVSLAAADLLEGVPKAVERRILVKAIESLLEGWDDDSHASTLSAIAALLMTTRRDILSLVDIVRIAEQLTASSPLLYFKPHLDGASHWTVRFGVEDRVIATVTQLDDDARTSVTAMVISLLFASLGASIRRKVVDADQLPRWEAIVNVLSRDEFEANIGPDLVKLGDLPNRFAISQSADIAGADQPPMVVICEELFGEPWRPNLRPLGDMHLLFARLLAVLSQHLLAREIEEEVLLPKVTRLVRTMGYSGNVGGRLSATGPA